MNKQYTSAVTGLDLTRKYAYMPDDQWALLERLRKPLGLSVSEYISHAIKIAASQAKEQNDLTRK